MEQVIENTMTKEEVAPEVLPIPPALQGIKGLGRVLDRPNANRSRYLLTGVPGSGKSALFFSNPRAIVIDLEKSAGNVPDPRALPFVPSSAFGGLAQSLRAFLDRLIQLGPDKGFEMVVFDTYDELVEIFQLELMSKNGLEDPGDYKGGHGKGYFVVRREIFRYLDRLARAGFGWALIAHITEKEKDGKSCRSLSVSGSYRDIAVRKSDHLLHMVTRVPPKVKTLPGGKMVTLPGDGDPEHFLALRPGGESLRGSLDDVKVRLPFPDSIPIPEFGGWEEFEAVFNTAVDLRLSQRKARIEEQPTVETSL